jgi:F-type H+-transporting ATPase subunit c
MKSKLVFLVVMLMVVATPIFAADGGGTNWVALTSGFAMAIASAGCGIAQAKAVAAACEGMARNPAASAAIRFALILGLALIESLALYTLVIIIMKVA